MVAASVVADANVVNFGRGPNRPKQGKDEIEEDPWTEEDEALTQQLDILLEESIREIEKTCNFKLVD